VGVERVVLENHGDVAVLRRDIVHSAVPDEDVAAGDFLEARNHPQGGRFATARWSHEHDEFLVLDFEVEVSDSGGFAAFFGGVVFEYVF
jgi:hypothetical protein